MQKSYFKQSAFTLIELLVALFIFFIVVTLLGISSKTLNKGISDQIKKINTQEKAYSFLDEISDEIHTIYTRKKDFPITGNKEKLQFTTIKKDSNGYLTLKHTEYKLTNNVIKKKQTHYIKANDTSTTEFTGIDSFSFAYLINNTWQEECDEKNQPTAIKITLALADTDHPFHTTAAIEMLNKRAQYKSTNEH